MTRRRKAAPAAPRTAAATRPDGWRRVRILAWAGLAAILPVCGLVA